MINFYNSSTNFSSNKEIKDGNNGKTIFQPFSFERYNYFKFPLILPFYPPNQIINNINNNFEFSSKNEKIIREQNNNDNNKNTNKNIININPNLEQINTQEQKIQNSSEIINSEEIHKKPEQTTTKFFTDYGGFGYKCSCSKTQCNRYYCECYRSGLYCIDCNCKNCQNKPPENYVSNRHQKITQTKSDIVTCTCTKSGCNKKYCECYKNGSKCNSACRCVSCENSEHFLNVKRIGEIYECCPANSIYIIKNEIYEEKIWENIFEKNKTKILEKKRKRSENGNNKISMN